MAGGPSQTPHCGTESPWRRRAWWLAPVLFCLLVYWPGLTAWFQQDDFQWLAQYGRVRSLGGLAAAVFLPTAHGTFRPLSERIPFLASASLAGGSALPFRLLAFLTQFAGLVLVMLVAARLTGRREAGLWAAVLWTANSSLSTVMAWSSGYMQILCAACLWGAFLLFLKYAETGERRYYAWQWVVFLLGFGVMETNLVYPALAGGYALLFARSRFKAALPMFAVSLAFVALHMMMAPKAAAGPYKMHFDPSMLATLGVYCRWALSPHDLATLFRHWPRWTGPVLVVSAGAALAAFVAWQTWKRRYLAAYLAGCFVLFLLPVLPLRDHLSAYYLTVPSSALGILGGYALVSGWRAGGWRKAAAVVLAGAFLAVQVPAARAGVKWWTARSHRVRALLQRIAVASEIEPEKQVLLTKVDEDFYGAALWYGALKALDLPRVRIDPESASRLHAANPYMPVSPDLVPAAAVIRAAAEQGLVAAYSIDGARLRRIPDDRIGRVSQGDWPVVVRLGEDLPAGFAGPEWYVPEKDFRWMPKRATLRMPGAARTGSRLVIAGVTVPEQMKPGPLGVEVRVGGESVWKREIAASGPFELSFELPPALAGRPEISLELEVERTFRAPGDVRDLGLAVGEVEIRSLR